MADAVVHRPKQGLFILFPKVESKAACKVKSPRTRHSLGTTVLRSMGSLVPGAA